ncbi:LOW QUALITY PROTEIN: 60S ribosomal protein L12, partial [Galemys pyrenaicus]
LPESGFIRHQPPPLCHLFNPNKVKVVYLWCTQWGSWCHVCPGPQDWTPWFVSQKMSAMTLPGQLAQIEVVPSASALIIKALKELTRDWQKQKNIKHRGNTMFDKILCGTNEAEIMSQKTLTPLKRSSAPRKLWAAMLITTTLMTSSMTTVHHAHDVIDDNSGAVECPASKKKKKKSKENHNKESSDQG